MTINDLGMLFKFIGGLGLFLYGMNIMADGLQKSAGGKLKNLMGFLTKNRFIAIIVGAIVTAIVQSSSATTVMVVGFVNAGMLSLAQAVGVIMGANVGTTITAWIVSMSEWSKVLKPEFFAPVVVGIGAFTMLFSKSENKKKVGEIMVGFGALFIGLSFMSDAIKPYRDSQLFVDAFTVLGRNPFLAILAGALVTAVIQSSSASVGILQTLALNGIVNWRSAVFITLGQNIGTCVTALLSSAGAGKNAKRASVIHLLFNTIGAVLFGVIMYVLFLFNPLWASSEISAVQISIFHTVFNVLVTLCLFPFGNLLVKLSMIFVRDDAVQVEESITDEIARKLDRRILTNPAFAVETAEKVVGFMGNLAFENATLAIEAIKTDKKNLTKKVYTNEDTINQLEKMLTAFLVEVDNLSLTETQHFKIKNLFYTINDYERIGDHSENIAELADTKRRDAITFSQKGYKDLDKIVEVTLESLHNALKAAETGSKDYADQVYEYESKVDQMETELREKHIQRLSKGKCVPESGVIFLDVISNLERISDHACNVAGYVSAERGK